jgi:hypothetical protein
VPGLEIEARVAQPLGEEPLVREASVEEAMVESDRAEDSIAKSLLLPKFALWRYCST